MNRILKRGMFGVDVEALQRGLGITADGVFGAATEIAVRAFQAANKLTVDGIVGPMTARELPLEAPIVQEDIKPENASFVDGFYQRARRVDAHPGRIGPVITPRAKIIHTTDMLEGSFNGLVRSWHESPGEGPSKGSCAHLLIGCTPAQGIVQMVSVFRNGNHAGGPSPGHFKLPEGKLVHPNSWAVGIEVHAGGHLGKRTPQGFVHADSRRVIPDENVFVDSKGVGWQKITPYQLYELNLLVRAIDSILAPMPAGTTIAPSGRGYASNGVPWAVAKNPVTSGHASHDPDRKTDPGPELMSWINAL